MAKGRRQSRFDYSRQYKKHRIVNDYKQTSRWKSTRAKGVKKDRATVEIVTIPKEKDENKDKTFSTLQKLIWTGRFYITSYLKGGYNNVQSGCIQIKI